MEDKISIPVVSKEFERLEIEGDFSNTIIENTASQYIETETQSYGYAKRIFEKNSPFVVTKKYFKNFFIKEKGLSFINGYPITFIYRFNETGELTEVINTDEGYDFGWEEIIEYCVKNEIELVKGYPKRGGIKTEIYKSEEAGKKVWTISYYKPKTEEYLEVTLDGETGKELKKRPLEFIGS